MQTTIPLFTSKAGAERYARETVGGLGFPSKMPGTAYGLPPRRCRTGCKLAVLPGTPCFDCYACKGRYTTTEADGTPGTVARAQERRLGFVDGDLDRWRDHFVALFNGLTAFVPEHKRYHRWHDAGDVQSVAHLRAICEIAERCPDWRFWLPTQEHGDLAAYLGAGGTVPENLCIRQSSPRLNARMVGRLGATSYIDTNEARRLTLAERCPAPETAGRCGDCRKCWDRSVPVVVYKKH